MPNRTNTPANYVLEHFTAPSRAGHPFAKRFGARLIDRSNGDIILATPSRMMKSQRYKRNLVTKHIAEALGIEIRHSP